MWYLFTVSVLLHVFQHSGAIQQQPVGPVVKREEKTTSPEGDIHVVYEAARSACHAEGRAFQCMPPFTNVAEGALISATSTCGERNSQEKYCRPRLARNGQTEMQCDPCSPSDRYSPRHLTDRHQMDNETYWVSGPVAHGKTVNLTLSLGKTFEVYYISLQPHGPIPDAVALYKSSDFGKTWQPWQYFSTDCYRAFKLPTSNEHYAQISAANIQEVLCVALSTPSGQERSGQSAKVIAFSTTIGRPSSQPWSSALVDWMTMTDLRISLTRFTDEPVHPSHREASELLLTPRLLSPANVLRVGDMEHPRTRSGTLGMSRHMGFQSDSSSTAMGKSSNNGAKEESRYAFSDVSVGGRCKCNGHANRCVRDRLKGSEEWGPLRCACEHNTAGTDCEKCAAGYLDQPWARATTEAANECKPCQCGNHTKQCIFSVKAFKQSNGLHGGLCVACQHHTEGPMCDQCATGYTRNPYMPVGSEQACRGCDCNLHSNACLFSQQIYLSTMKTSGGVCQHCQHHTVGRRCHECASEYYRDWTKPVSHDEVCIECQCHPIGSVPNKPCDRKTGQCVCKPGVIGQACNRCQEGYKQTRMSDQPCIKALEHFAYRKKAPRDNSSPQSTRNNVQNTNPQCPPCKSHKKRIRFKRFCQREAVFLGTIKSYKTDKDKIRYEVHIDDTWRVDGAAGHLLPKKASPTLPPFPIWAKSKTTTQVDARGQPLRCFCPNLEIGQSYLFLTQSYQIPHENRMELMLDERSIVLPWRKAWRRRLTKFVRRASRGRCHDNNNGKPNFAHPSEVTQFRRVQRVRTAPGYYPTHLHPNRALGGSAPPASTYHPTYTNRRQVYGMAADQAPVRRQTSPQGHPASRSRFTYYRPYGYQNKVK